MPKISAYVKRRMRDAGVELLDAEKLYLKCNVDGTKYYAEPKQSGRLGRDWWKCPNGCSEKKK